MCVRLLVLKKGMSDSEPSAISPKLPPSLVTSSSRRLTTSPSPGCRLATSSRPPSKLVKKAVDLSSSKDLRRGRCVRLYDTTCCCKDDGDQEHLFELEQALTISDNEKPLYVLYPDESGKWRIQAVPLTPDSFESRKALPEPWRGLRDEELSTKTGVPGCIFIHASGFIGGVPSPVLVASEAEQHTGHANKGGALELARKALAF